MNPQPNEEFNYLLANNGQSNEQSIDLKEVTKEWSIYVAKIYDSDKGELPFVDDLDDEKKDLLIGIVKRKNQLIKRFLFFIAIKKDYPNLVNEFDWNVNLILATDQISNLNRPLANLQFNNSNNEKICNLELNEDELDQLIEAVEKIQNEFKSLLSV